ncbi:helix-turn-helix domain-containing protein [Streptomyces sp. NBC_01451]|uniref:helix-turn-helix domain-containing protein n=1 Tax=Streptomyces sp. NBC_01451 TaxID=2903872 RepID=UPI002E35FEAB|nr:helix-turn-helix transcriptional regulator [Streptomyces sp. NBC_01451]
MGGLAFAEATGWVESKVSRLENGKRNPGEDDIRTWCTTPNRQEHIDELWLEWRRQFQTGAEQRQKKALPVHAEAFALLKQSALYGTAVRDPVLTAGRQFDQLPGAQESTMRPALPHGPPSVQEAAGRMRGPRCLSGSRRWSGAGCRRG